MTDEKYPSQLAERFQIRMPDGLRDRIKAEAEANGRSMNAEIVQRLNEAYEQVDFRHHRDVVPEWTEEEIEQYSSAPLRSDPSGIKKQLDEISEQQRLLSENFQKIVDAIESTRHPKKV